MPFHRAYLRASTQDQDATRARDQLDQFARDHGFTIACWYVENESGASLKRPELFRLLGDCREGDVLLVEQVDRLSRLNAEDWESLKAQIQQKRVKVVALDLPTSWQLLQTNGDEFTGRLLDARNSMMLDMLAAVARKDYEDRRRRQRQGIERAKASEPAKYRGRPVDQQKHQNIRELLSDPSKSWSRIQLITGASRSTVARVAKEMRTEAT